MLRTGQDYIESLRDGREVWIDGEQVEDVTTHPAFAPMVNVRARIYDLGHEAGTAGPADLRRRADRGALRHHLAPAAHPRRLAGQAGISRRHPRRRRRRGHPRGRRDGRRDVVAVRRAGRAERDRPGVLGEHRPVTSGARSCSTRSTSRPTPTRRATARSGRKTRTPTYCCTWSARPTTASWCAGAKFETAAAYANQAFVKPTIGEWNNEVLSDYAVGFLADMGAPGIKHICRSAFAAQRAPDDYPLTSRYDEIDTMIVFDNVEIPWENVFFYRHTKAAAFIRATLHRYSIYPYVQRYLRFADFLLGVAYASARSTGVTMHQGVREKIAQIACYREGVNAHLTAAIELAQPSPGGLLMPNQPMMYAGRVFASTQLPAVMHILRDLCGCQVSLMPSKAMFDTPGAGEWLRKYFTIGEIPAEERRKLFALARDLLNSDYAGHRLTFQLFAQSPPFSHLLAVYNNYDFSGPLDLVARYSDVADAVRK